METFEKHKFYNFLCKYSYTLACVIIAVLLLLGIENFFVYATFTIRNLLVQTHKEIFGM